MSLDDILKKKVWGPLDAKKQERALDGLGNYDDKNFKKAVIDANQTKGLKLQAELSKKSVIGLFIIAFLLIFCGYETSLPEECDALLYDLHTCMAYTMSLFLMSQFIFQRYIFKKWKYTVWYIITIVTFYFLIYFFDLSYGRSIVEKVIVKNIGIFTCVIVTIPILWQIFVTWQYKSVFYGFIKAKIRKAHEEYEHIVNEISNGNYENLPKQYHEIYMKNSQKTPDTTPKQAMDDSLTEYKGILYNDIRTIGNNVRLMDLFGSWSKYKLKTILDWIRGVFKSKGSTLVSHDKLQVKNYEFYARIFEAQKARPNALKMKAFCQTKNINFEEFKNYYCRYCQKK